MTCPKWLAAPDTLHCHQLPWLCITATAVKRKKISSRSVWEKLVPAVLQARLHSQMARPGAPASSRLGGVWCTWADDHVSAGFRWDQKLVDWWPHNFVCRPFSQRTPEPSVFSVCGNISKSLNLSLPSWAVKFRQTVFTLFFWLCWTCKCSFSPVGLNLPRRCFLFLGQPFLEQNSNFAMPETTSSHICWFVLNARANPINKSPRSGLEPSHSPRWKQLSVRPASCTLQPYPLHTIHGLTVGIWSLIHPSSVGLGANG